VGLIHQHAGHRRPAVQGDVEEYGAGIFPDRRRR
jgi:hypothetical protein